MGRIGGEALVDRHRPFGAVEHGVERAGHRAELVVAPGTGGPVCQVAAAERG